MATRTLVSASNSNFSGGGCSYECYSPTLRGERETFFASLLRWDLVSSNTILAGDFIASRSLFSIGSAVTALTGRKARPWTEWLRH